MPCTTRPWNPADCAAESHVCMGFVSPQRDTYDATSWVVKQRSISNFCPSCTTAAPPFVTVLASVDNLRPDPVQKSRLLRTNTLSETHSQCRTGASSQTPQNPAHSCCANHTALSLTVRGDPSRRQCAAPDRTHRD